MASNLLGIFLNGNQLYCDCLLKPFKEDFRSSSTRVWQTIQPDKLECSYPASLTDKKLTEIDLDSLTCNTPDLLAVEPPKIKKHSWTGLIWFFVGVGFTALAWFIYPYWNRYQVTRNYPTRSRGEIFQKSETDKDFLRNDF